MAEPIENLLKHAIEMSERIYHRLVLLVGESGSGKTSTLNHLSNELGIEIINLNLRLSEQLLEITPKKRPLQLPKILDQVIREAGEIAILDNIEIMFDTSLKQDPLKLLQKISRNKTIISSWNGKQDHLKLLYAERGHPEYRNYKISDFLTVSMDGTSNFDSSTKS